MLTIGCHLSSSRGYLAMGKEAVKINANTFQFFTRNPRGAKAKDIDPEDVAKFFSFAKEHGIEKAIEVYCGLTENEWELKQLIMAQYKEAEKIR